MIRISLNLLLLLISQSKIVGKGKKSNSEILVRLMEIIADGDNSYISKELYILDKLGFGDYTQSRQYVTRLINTGNGYPYDIIRISEFEKNIGNNIRYQNYLLKMKKFCDNCIDISKMDSLVYTLLEIIFRDNDFVQILYGNKFIEKEQLFGNYAHPKKICIEALLVGLLYHVNKYPQKSEKINLFSVPERLKFKTVRFKDEKSLDFDISVNLAENIIRTAKSQVSADMKYKPSFKCNGEFIDVFPKKQNIFLHGAGGTGKTTLLLNQLKSDEVSFYFPLYNYREEAYQYSSYENCWILVNILLKYHYQYQYSTYDTCCACEGRETVLALLSELENILKHNPENLRPEFVILLDGINEISTELRIVLEDELQYITREWHNVRLIVSGRNVPYGDLFGRFRKIEMCGISESELNRVLSETHSTENISDNSRLMQIIKIPLFLNFYLESGSERKNLCSKGEILDYYINNLDCRISHISINHCVFRFIVQYILPFVAYSMKFQYEVKRGDIKDSVNKAFNVFFNERVYQNYLVPKNFNKNIIVKAKNNYDFTELIVNNTGLMKVSENSPDKLVFVHEYFRDYFSARYIVNLLEAVLSYGNSHKKEKEKFFSKNNIGSIWYSYQQKEIHRLIGEICGDYRNVPDSDGKLHYHTTILDKALELGRQFFTLRLAENIIMVMESVRNGIICNADFSENNITFDLPYHVKFSLDGKYPCFFRNCLIENTVCDSNVNCCKYSPDNKFLFISFDYGYSILWNTEKHEINWEIDLSDYVDPLGCEFECADFQENIIEITSVMCQLRLELSTGKILNIYQSPCKNYSFIDEYDDKKINYKTDIINDELKNEIFSHFNHFKNCDLNDSKCGLFNSKKDDFRRLGAIVE